MAGKTARTLPNFDATIAPMIQPTIPMPANITKRARDWPRGAGGALYRYVVGASIATISRYATKTVNRAIDADLLMSYALPAVYDRIPKPTKAINRIACGRGSPRRE